MNTIAKYALIHGEINIQNLAVVLDALEKDTSYNIEHILAVILGLECPAKLGDIAQHSILRDGQQRSRFKRYDILRDSVVYEYDAKTTLWFKTADDAKKYADGSSYYNLDYKYSEKPDYPFSGTKKYVAESSCSRDEWLENAVR